MIDPLSARSTIAIDGWTVHTYDTLPSTNPVAGQLPPWHAVRAITQTKGYGRTGKAWISDAGGLWLSAALPTPGDLKNWAILPLAVGWALIETFERDFGISGLRLRWPNDLMVGPNKLSGILMEKFRADTAVAGIGINVSNNPQAVDASLGNTAVSLAQIVPGPAPSHDTVLTGVLAALRRTHATIAAQGFAPIASQLNARWGEARRVEITMDTIGAAGKNTLVRGAFSGVDGEGRLLFLPDGAQSDQPQALDPVHVALLREIRT